MTVVYDITINKKAKYLQEFQQVDENEDVIPLTAYKVFCDIKKSKNSNTKLFELTEDNSGVDVIDRDNGVFRLQIPADQTDIKADYGFYDVLIKEETKLDTTGIRIMQGSVIFSDGITL